MTISVNLRAGTLRKVAVVAVTALVLLAVYLLGALRSGASASAAVAPTPTGFSAAGGAVTGVAVTSPGSVDGASPSIGGSGSASGQGITVTATGKVTGRPDTLRLDLGVSTSGATVTATLASANAAERAVQKALHDGGVADKDIQSSGLSVQPNYDYSKTGGAILKGYQVNESVDVALRNIDKAGDLIGSAVTAGGNAVRVNGISLDLEDNSSLLAGARSQAFAAAKAKAQQYATAAGRGLGDVISINETVQATSPQVPYAAAMDSAAGAASVPIQAGSQAVGVTVTVVFGFR
jgi:uncharacterized protein YggE